MKKQGGPGGKLMMSTQKKAPQNAMVKSMLSGAREAASEGVQSSLMNKTTKKPAPQQMLMNKTVKKAPTQQLMMKTVKKK